MILIVTSINFFMWTRHSLFLCTWLLHTWILTELTISIIWIQMAPLKVEYSNQVSTFYLLSLSISLLSVSLWKKSWDPANQWKPANWWEPANRWVPAKIDGKQVAVGFELSTPWSTSWRIRPLDHVVILCHCQQFLWISKICRKALFSKTCS